MPLDDSNVRRARKARAFESRREREFYLYYEPILSLRDAPPTLCDLNDPESVAAHRPASSPDKALTAFAQLAALRLRTRRAMLFFFDVDYAYVLAEATRTLSLQDDSCYDAEDGLWLGASKIPRGHSVCEVTVNLPANGGSNAQDEDSSSLVHIINDLREDTRFCDRAYVQGGPLARFYAGVPITTPRGLNIGAFCVLDDKPRDGLDASEIRFLRDMAATTMTHLDMVRAKAENQRSRDMTTGLGAFMNGKSKLRDWWLESNREKTRAKLKVTSLSTTNAVVTRERRSAVNRADFDGQYSSPAEPKFLPRVHGRRSLPRSVSSSPERNVSPSDDLAAANSTHGTEVNDLSKTQQPTNPYLVAEQMQEDMLSTTVRETLDRAASLLREALGVDGVQFLDASVRTFGGLVSGLHERSETEISTEASGPSEIEVSMSRMNISAQAGSRRRRNIDANGGYAKHCLVLASACSTTLPPTPLEAVTECSNVPEVFLKTILRRYPRGRVWNFNYDGDASSDDTCEDSLSSASAGDSIDSEEDVEDARSVKRRRKRKWARIEDGRMVQKSFPGVRSLMFIGMWDTRQERWFASAVVWSYSPTRILSEDSELSFLAAFCDVILAQVSRIEVNTVERTKNDFVANISHELRSPLHGILGCAETIQDHQQDELTHEMVRSIHSCGTALLDIVSAQKKSTPRTWRVVSGAKLINSQVNKLLDYSRIKNRTTPSGVTYSRASRFSFPAGVMRGSLSGPSEPAIPVQLDSLTEVVVQTVCDAYAKHAQNQHAVLLGENLAITLNIDRSAGSSWKFTVSADDWTTICKNLVANAVIFTQEGYVSVGLTKKEHDSAGMNRRAMVILTVTDSGVGMSKAFQEHDLFKPFRQENSLTEGTGLGLTVVAEVVRSLGGTLQVKSSKNVGTTIEVALPLEYAPATDDASAGAAHETIPHITSVGLAGFAEATENQRRPTPVSQGRRNLLSCLRSSCADLGINHYVVQDQEYDGSAQLYILLEHEARALLQRLKSSGSSVPAGLADRPVLLLCDSQASRMELQSLWNIAAFRNEAQCIWQPIYPSKLEKAISACLAGQSIAPSGRNIPNTRSQGIFSGTELPASSTPPDHPTTPLKTPVRETSSDPVKEYTFSPAKPQTPSQELADGTAEHTQSLSLLLVDDNAINLKLLVVYAKKHMYRYQTASNGLEAVEAYKAALEASTSNSPCPSVDDGTSSGEALQLVGGGHVIARVPKKPDVILMDLNMPIMDGWVATRKIRELERAADVNNAAKIVALTGLGSREAEHKSFSHGMDLFLTKPVRLKDLTSLLAEMKEDGNKSEG